MHLFKNLTWTISPNVNNSTLIGKTSSSNFFVFFCLFFVILLYLIVLLISIIKEKRRKIDLILLDNAWFSYKYIISIETGYHYGSGTTSEVAIKMIGTNRNSSHLHVKDDMKTADCLKNGSSNYYLVTSPENLGEIYRVEVILYNKGSNPNWFLNYIKVHEYEQKKEWNFPCYRWLSTKGYLERFLFLSQKSDLSLYQRFRHRYLGANKYIITRHMWFSLFTKEKFLQPGIRKINATFCLSSILSVYGIQVLLIEMYSISSKIDSISFWINLIIIILFVLFYHTCLEILLYNTKMKEPYQKDPQVMHEISKNSLNSSFRDSDVDDLSINYNMDTQTIMLNNFLNKEIRTSFQREKQEYQYRNSSMLNFEVHFPPDLFTQLFRKTRCFNIWLEPNYPQMVYFSNLLLKNNICFLNSFYSNLLEPPCWFSKYNYVSFHQSCHIKINFLKISRLPFWDVILSFKKYPIYQYIYWQINYQQKKKITKINKNAKLLEFQRCEFSLDGNYLQQCIENLQQCINQTEPMGHMNEIQSRLFTSYLNNDLLTSLEKENRQKLTTEPSLDIKLTKHDERQNVLVNIEDINIIQPINKFQIKPLHNDSVYRTGSSVLTNQSYDALESLKIQLTKDVTFNYQNQKQTKSLSSNTEIAVLSQDNKLCEKVSKPYTKEKLTVTDDSSSNFSSIVKKELRKTLIPKKVHNLKFLQENADSFSDFRKEKLFKSTSVQHSPIKKKVCSTTSLTHSKTKQHTISNNVNRCSNKSAKDLSPNQSDNFNPKKILLFKSNSTMECKFVKDNCINKLMTEKTSNNRQRTSKKILKQYPERKTSKNMPNKSCLSSNCKNIDNKVNSLLKNSSTDWPQPVMLKSSLHFIHSKHFRKKKSLKAIINTTISSSISSSFNQLSSNSLEGTKRFSVNKKAKSVLSKNAMSSTFLVDKMNEQKVNLSHDLETEKAKETNNTLKHCSTIGKFDNVPHNFGHKNFKYKIKSNDQLLLIHRSASESESASQIINKSDLANQKWDKKYHSWPTISPKYYFSSNNNNYNKPIRKQKNKNKRYLHCIKKKRLIYFNKKKTSNKVRIHKIKEKISKAIYTLIRDKNLDVKKLLCYNKTGLNINKTMAQQSDQLISKYDPQTSFLKAEANFFVNNGQKCTPHEILETTNNFRKNESNFENNINQMEKISSYNFSIVSNPKYHSVRKAQMTCNRLLQEQRKNKIKLEHHFISCSNISLHEKSKYTQSQEISFTRFLKNYENQILSNDYLSNVSSKSQMNKFSGTTIKPDYNIKNEEVNADKNQIMYLIFKKFILLNSNMSVPRSKKEIQNDIRLDFYKNKFMKINKIRQYIFFTTTMLPYELIKSAQILNEKSNIVCKIKNSNSNYFMNGIVNKNELDFLNLYKSINFKRKYECCTLKPYSVILRQTQKYHFPSLPTIFLSLPQLIHKKIFKLYPSKKKNTVKCVPNLFSCIIHNVGQKLKPKNSFRISIKMLFFFFKNPKNIASIIYLHNCKHKTFPKSTQSPTHQFLQRITQSDENFSSMSLSEIQTTSEEHLQNIPKQVCKKYILLALPENNNCFMKETQNVLSTNKHQNTILQTDKDFSKVIISKDKICISNPLLLNQFYQNVFLRQMIFNLPEINNFSRIAIQKDKKRTSYMLTTKKLSLKNQANENDIIEKKGKKQMITRSKYQMNYKYVIDILIKDHFVQNTKKQLAEKYKAAMKCAYRLFPSVDIKSIFRLLIFNLEYFNENFYKNKKYQTKNKDYKLCNHGDYFAPIDTTLGNYESEQLNLIKKLPVVAYNNYEMNLSVKLKYFPSIKITFSSKMKWLKAFVMHHEKHIGPKYFKKQTKNEFPINKHMILKFIQMITSNYEIIKKIPVKNFQHYLSTQYGHENIDTFPSKNVNNQKQINENYFPKVKTPKIIDIQDVTLKEAAYILQNKIENKRFQFDYKSTRHLGSNYLNFLPDSIKAMHSTLPHITDNKPSHSGVSESLSYSFNLKEFAFLDNLAPSKKIDLTTQTAQKTSDSSIESSWNTILINKSLLSIAEDISLDYPDIYSYSSGKTHDLSHQTDRSILGQQELNSDFIPQYYMGSLTGKQSPDYPYISSALLFYFQMVAKGYTTKLLPSQTSLIVFGLLLCTCCASFMTAMIYSFSSKFNHLFVCCFLFSIFVDILVLQTIKAFLFCLVYSIIKKE